MMRSTCNPHYLFDLMVSSGCHPSVIKSLAKEYPRVLQKGYPCRRCTEPRHVVDGALDALSDVDLTIRIYDSNAGDDSNPDKARLLRERLKILASIRVLIEAGASGRVAEQKVRLRVHLSDHEMASLQSI